MHKSSTSQLNLAGFQCFHTYMVLITFKKVICYKVHHIIKFSKKHISHFQSDCQKKKTVNIIIGQEKYTLDCCSHLF